MKHSQVTAVVTYITCVQFWLADNSCI